MTAPYRIIRSDQRVTPVSNSDNEEFKGYLDRLMKMLPGEVVGLYLIGSGFIPPTDTRILVVWSCICIAGVVATRVYGTMDTAKNEPPDWIHTTISVIAFIIWLYTLGGPFIVFHLYVPYIGSLLVLAWTFFVPLFYHGPKK